MTVTRVTVEGDQLVVEIEGLDKLWAVKSRLSIPLVNVVGAVADPGVGDEHKGLRAPGTHLPGVIVAGTYYTHGERVFWDVHDPAKAVVITLTNQRYARLVVEVDDPAATVALITRAAR
jgi:hypothetical protein